MGFLVGSFVSFFREITAGASLQSINAVSHITYQEGVSQFSFIEACSGFTGILGFHQSCDQN